MSDYRKDFRKPITLDVIRDILYDPNLNKDWVVRFIIWQIKESRLYNPISPHNKIILDFIDQNKPALVAAFNNYEGGYYESFKFEIEYLTGNLIKTLNDLGLPINLDKLKEQLLIKKLQSV